MILFCPHDDDAPDQTAAGPGFWAPYFGAAVNSGTSFNYIADPLFLAASALYVLNCLVLKPALQSPFLSGQLNDLLLVPCAIPILLLSYRVLGLRPRNGAPRAAEIFPILALWTLLFETAGPWLFSQGVADWRDVMAYWAGGAGAWAWWRTPGAAQ